MSDISVTASGIALGAGTVSTDSGTAGATITAGEPIYKDSSASDQLKPCIATSSAAANCVGISLHAALSGQPIKYITGGNLAGGFTLTVGQVYAVSANAAGAIAPYSDLGSGNYVTVLGVATAAGVLPVRLNVSGIAKP